MATIYRKTYRRALPEGAEVVCRNGKQVARWTDGNGHKQTAEVADDGQNIIVESQAWYARYRDADGIERRVSTKCRDEQAARQVLADLLAEAEKVRAGILTAQEMQASRHADRPLKDHFADYLEYLKAKTVRGRKVSEAHRDNVGRQLECLADECSLRRLGDITRQRMVRWLNAQADAGERAPRTVNTYRAALVAFCSWAVKEGRLTTNPLEGLPKADESEVRRERRALSQEEIAALLEAARTRPLRDALTIRTGPRKGELAATVRPHEQERLQQLGGERELTYRTMIYTGLRKGELASLTVGALHLDGPGLYVELEGKNAKSGKGARIPLREDLAEDLRDHLAAKLSAYQLDTLANGRKSVPASLPPDMKVLNVPRGLIRIFDRDLVAAGLARKVKDPKTGKTRTDKTDAQGRTLDVHSLRHTFATMLSKAGVAPRMAQELLRHSDIRLTMNTYTHLELVDVQGAVEALPGVSGPHTEGEGVRATGTYGAGGDGEIGAVIGDVIGDKEQESSGARGQALAKGKRARGRRGPSQRFDRGRDRQAPTTEDVQGSGAGDRIRTGDVQLGKLTFYR